MSEEIINEIDEILNEDLPDEPERIPETVAAERKQEIIQLLQYAADELGSSPSAREFNSLELRTSARTIQKVFGSWNQAKQEAGLDTYDVGEGKTDYINSEYFSEIDSSTKAYWLGTLFSASSLKDPGDYHYLLIIGRVEEKRFFVEQFAEATDSEYSIQAYENKQSGKSQFQLQISDREFIEDLLSQGYPGVNEEVGEFPELDTDYYPAFIRGYIEASNRTFTGSPTRIRMGNEGQAGIFQEWLEEIGLDRPTITERPSDGVGINITNAFEIKALFEGVYPNGVSTTPSYKPYPRAMVDYLENEYPYPENVDYLSG